MSELASLQETIAALTERLDRLESRDVKEDKEECGSSEHLYHKGDGESARDRPFSSFASLGYSQECAQDTSHGGEDSGAQGQQRPPQAGVPPYWAAVQSQSAQVSSSLPMPVYLVGPRQGPTPTQPDFRSQYEAIKNSVNNIVLEPDFVLNENRSGISANDSEQAAILARNGKFIETQLRLMQELQESFSDQNKVAVILDKIHVVQKAQMQYVQEEYSGLQIAGQFGPQAKSVFKSIRCQTTAYTPALIEDIKIVVNVTGGTGGRFGNRPPRPQGQAQSFNPQFRGRGNFFRPRRPFFNSFNNFSNSQPYQNCPVPK